MRLASGIRLGPYEVLALLGTGGMAEVYRARDTRLGREVAIKVVSEALGADSDFVERFEREARLVGSLTHPNVVALHDVGVHDGKPYFVTELLQGETLRTRLGKGAVPLPTALDWATQMAQGLAAAHARGIVHRDLKPENVFVTRDGHVKLLDFGIAKAIAAAHDPQWVDGAASHELLQETVSSSPGKTSTGFVIGTPGYMSPEQLQGDPVDARTDLFSLGCGASRAPLGPARLPWNLGRREQLRDSPSRAPDAAGLHSARGRSGGPPVPREGPRPAIPVRARPRLPPRRAAGAAHGPGGRSRGAGHGLPPLVVDWRWSGIPRGGRERALGSRGRRKVRLGPQAWSQRRARTGPACGSDAVDRCTAVRESQLGQGAGVLLRRDHRGAPQRARAREGAEGRGASVVVPLQGEERGSPHGRRDTGSDQHRRRVGPEAGKPGAHHRPAHPGGGRFRPLVANVRRRPDQRLRSSRRDCPRDHQRVEGRAPGRPADPVGPGGHQERRGLRALSPGDCDLQPPGRPAVP